MQVPVAWKAAAGVSCTHAAMDRSAEFRKRMDNLFGSIPIWLLALGLVLVAPVYFVYTLREEFQVTPRWASVKAVVYTIAWILVAAYMISRPDSGDLWDNARP